MASDWAAGERNPERCGPCYNESRRSWPGNRGPSGDRGKSELHRAVCLVTRGRGDPTESATENIPPCFGGVRVKRCGKSAPRGWQQPWQGKPHTEQGRIEKRSRKGLRAARPTLLGRPQDPGSDPGTRGMIAVSARAEKQDSAYGQLRLPQNYGVTLFSFPVTLPRLTLASN